MDTGSGNNQPFMGGFSLSNISGPGGVAAGIVALSFVLLGGLYWLFRDVAQF